MMTSRILSVLLLQSLFALVVRATIYVSNPGFPGEVSHELTRDGRVLRSPNLYQARPAAVETLAL